MTATVNCVVCTLEGAN